VQIVKLFKSVWLNPWTFILLPWTPFLLMKMMSNVAIPKWMKVLLLLLQFIIPLAAISYSCFLTDSAKSLRVYLNGLILRFSGSVFVVIMVGEEFIAKSKDDPSSVGIVLFGAFVTGYFVKHYDHSEVRRGQPKIAWAAELLALLNQSNGDIKDEQIPTCFLKNSPACVFENYPTCRSLGVPLCDWKQGH